MHVIEADNANVALAMGISHLLAHGIEETSRNGSVLVAPGPVCTVYKNPHRHVIFSPTRDANPFFHFMEALWMLAGRKDVKWPTYFNSKYESYSDDGKTVWGAYGWRWRSFFGYDQLVNVIDELHQNPTSRRVVLSMWDARRHNDNEPSWRDKSDAQFESTWTSDLDIAVRGGKDVPCNTHCYVDVRGGKLNLTVCCRSNDIIWGCYGANVVHFSMLAIYLADCLQVPVGEYRQFSNNFHVYTDVFTREKLNAIAGESFMLEGLSKDLETTTDAFYESETYGTAFDVDLRKFMEWSTERINGGEDVAMLAPLQTEFFLEIAAPMFQSYFWHKRKDRENARHFSHCIKDLAWRKACEDWLERRYAK